MTSPPFLSPVHSVRAYYEQNSVWFRLAGKRQHTLAIHRPVWVDGTDNRQAALNYVNQCISAQVQTAADRRPGTQVRLLDLGCGFGGTLHYLVRAHGAKLWAAGMTISIQQAQATQEWIRALGVEERCSVVAGDFHALPLAGRMDLVCSVEAFAHAGEPARYFSEAARLLRPGGRLILCDDFRIEPAVTDSMDDSDRRWLALFKAGWHVPHLLAPHQVTALALCHGLRKVEDRDLNPYLRVRAFPDAVLPVFEQLVARAGRYASLLGSIIGGWALENAIQRGHITYRFMVFEKAT